MSGTNRRLPEPGFSYDAARDALTVCLTLEPVLETGAQVHGFVNSAIEGAGAVHWAVSGAGHLLFVTIGAASRNVPAAVLRSPDAKVTAAWVGERPGRVFLPLFDGAEAVVANRWPTQVPGLQSTVATATARSGRIVGLLVDDAVTVLEPNFLSRIVGSEPEAS